MGYGQSLDFVVVGAPKTGTTWLHKCCQEHPEVRTTVNKETWFFHRHFPFWRTDLKEDEFFKRGFDWYWSNFEKEKASHRSTGEIATQYFYDNYAARRIYQHYPHARIIIVLRSPSRRTHSHFEDLKSKNMYSIPETLDEMKREHPEFFDMSHYAPFIKSYNELFGRERVLILFYEDLVHSPELFLKTFFQFIEVDPYFSPSILSKKINKTSDQYHKKRLFGLYNKLLKWPVIGHCFGLMSNPKAKRVILPIVNKTVGALEGYGKTSDLQWLEELYEKDIEELKSIIQKELPFKF